MNRPIFPELTEREKEILDLIIQGYTNKEICEKLVIAPNTLKCHLATLYQKHFLSINECGYSEMRLKLALNYLKPILLDNKFLYTQNAKLREQNRDLQEEVKPFRDEYFNGLSFKNIADLAKKSIRLTEENKKFEFCLQELLKFCNAFDGSNPDVNEILRLVKYKINKLAEVME